MEPWVGSLVQADRASLLRFPSFLLLDPGDAAITAGLALGIALAVLAGLGVLPRLCLFLSAPLYLSYVVASGDFLFFQWDSLLIECLVIGAFVPRDRSSPGSHWIARALLCKLYLESGIGKAQSGLGDWLDGSAMTFYYETAPLPAWPGWWAHQLPDAWHALETWGALGLELVGALLILGPRRARLAALAGFTGFQALNLATANYGFFVYLALALHVFLLDDADLARVARRLPWPRAPGLHRVAAALRRVRPPDSLRPATSATAGLLAAAWLAASLVTAVGHFAPPGAVADTAFRLMQTWRVYRVANAYHLFGYITRERIEVEFQTSDGTGWRAHDLHYKPGDPQRAPPLVAPHQPRVDFLLWFYALEFRHGAPPYLANLLARMCADPEAVAPLFAGPLPARPDAVRIEYWRYHFTTPEQRDATGAWWRREPVGTSEVVDCRRLRRD